MENWSDTLLLLSHQCIFGPVPIVPGELLYYFWHDRHFFNPKHCKSNEEYVRAEVKTDESRDWNPGLKWSYHLGQYDALAGTEGPLTLLVNWWKSKTCWFSYVSGTQMFAPQNSCKGGTGKMPFKEGTRKLLANSSQLMAPVTCYTSTACNKGAAGLRTRWIS